MIYLIGSLRNPNVPLVADELRTWGFEVFDDWYAAGPEADDYWRDYEMGRGHNFTKALKGYAARHVFSFDHHHLDRATTVILLMPAGKSGHLEFGWAVGRGKKGYILLDGEPERFDVMYQFAHGVFTNMRQLVDQLIVSQSCLGAAAK
jgi:hypothetical protein